MESQPIPGTWIFPGVLQVACKALRALRLGDFGTKLFVAGAAGIVPGIFSLSVVEEEEILGAELSPLVFCLLSVI